MSNISRRDFLKTAGVMTLAVAAAGVLAGCEGNVAEPEKPIEMTDTTVTIGNYTLSIKDAKQFSITATDNNQKTTEARYVVVVGNLLKIDESKTGAPKFTWEQSTSNLSAPGTAVGATGVKEQFGLAVKPVTVAQLDTANFVNQTEAGTPFYYAYKVDTYKDDSFKKPEFKLVVTEEKEQIVKLVANIPAAVTVKSDDLKKA